MQNDMRGRIVELLRAYMHTECDKHEDCLDCPYCNDEDACYEHLATVCADHLIANGVIVPPCKVGDKVYYIDGKTIVPSVVHCISFGGRHGVNAKGQIHIQDSDKDTITVNFDQLGKKVFKTYEQAEQKLAGNEG